jgi:hypothetical protein
MTRISLVFLLAIAALPSCSKVQEMHNATMEMNSTTSDLADVSSQMNKMMAEVYDSGRQGASLDLRNKLFDIAVNAPKIEEKATNAGLYFLAFEFQLWSNLGQDNREGERERLMKDAVEEFFCHMLSITHWTEVDPFAGKNPLAFGEAENERAIFNAFALTLEKNNRKQDITTTDNGIDALSMRNLIENALLADQKIKAGEARITDFPAYVDIVRQHEELAVRLLKARYQMLGLAVLTQLTPIARNNWEGFKYKIWGKSWNIDLKKVNSSALRLAAFRLKEANRARDFLASIGEKVELDSSIAAIYANAKVTNAPALKAEGEVSSESDALKGEFAAELANYLK